MPTSKAEAKAEVAKLIAKYQQLSPAEVKKFNEANTKQGFIEPLFKALGWDVDDTHEVTLEEKASKGRVDYAFKLKGISKFYLEAKAFKEDLNKQEYIQQAVEYAYNKGVTWAVLFNFESMHVYVAQTDKLCLNLQTANYMERFDDLWLLSRESFETDETDKWGETYGHLPERQGIEDKLYQQFKQWRDILFKQIHRYNKHLTNNDINEVIQRFLNRLIFIRNCEDKKIENNKLRAALNSWKTGGYKGELIEKIQLVFQEFAGCYDSDLFEPHLTDSISVESATVEEIIEGLYKVPGSIANYDFSIMEPDVLGKVYEQYLGYVTSLRKKGFEEEQKATKKHRKEQGIYYTPTFITNYIVQETVGQFIKDHSGNQDEILNMKVLDPACGSGSFLIRAFDEVLSYYASIRNKTSIDLDQHERLRVLLANIFGVDLDKQAVEIARLNLLLRILKEPSKLEMLENNIKRGNSLISGSEDELKKYFGKNWENQEPFNWEDRFANIMSNGGFDIVIGNPPWVSLTGKHKSLDLSSKELQYLFDKYDVNTYSPNLYEAFIRRVMDLMKDDALFSFIVPDRLASNQQFVKLREYILKNFTIRKLLFRFPFPGVMADTMVFVIQKTLPKEGGTVEVLDFPSKKVAMISQSTFASSADSQFQFVDPQIAALFSKISGKSGIKRLDEIAKSTSGCGAKTSEIHEKRLNKKEIKILKGENIGKYTNKGHLWFEFDKDNLSGRTRDEKKLGIQEKVLIRKTGSDIIATFDDSGIYPEQSLYFLYDTDKDNLLYLLAILNSSLMNTYYKNFAVTNRDTTPQLKNVDLDKFPIIDPLYKKSIHDSLITQAKAMLDLNEKLQKTEQGLDEWHDIETEIKGLGKKIDDIVCNLYGLNKAEKKLVAADN